MKYLINPEIKLEMNDHDPVIISTKMSLSDDIKIAVDEIESIRKYVIDSMESKILPGIINTNNSISMILGKFISIKDIAKYWEFIYFPIKKMIYGLDVAFGLYLEIKSNHKSHYMMDRQYPANELPDSINADNCLSMFYYYYTEIQKVLRALYDTISNHSMTHVFDDFTYDYINTSKMLSIFTYDPYVKYCHTIESLYIPTYNNHITIYYTEDLTKRLYCNYNETMSPRLLYNKAYTRHSINIDGFIDTTKSSMEVVSLLEKEFTLLNQSSTTLLAVLSTCMAIYKELEGKPNRYKHFIDAIKNYEDVIINPLVINCNQGDTDPLKSVVYNKPYFYEHIKSFYTNIIMNAIMELRGFISGGEE